MTRKEQIKNAYKMAGGYASFYDGMMTYSTIPGKAICRIVWNMDGEKNLHYLEKVDVPVSRICQNHRRAAFLSRCIIA